MLKNVYLESKFKGKNVLVLFLCEEWELVSISQGNYVGFVIFFFFLFFLFFFPFKISPEFCQLTRS